MSLKPPKNQLTRDALHDMYDRACSAVYDVFENEPDERIASKLETMYLSLATLREKYDVLSE
jgi:hypothetical protein